MSGDVESDQDLFTWWWTYQDSRINPSPLAGNVVDVAVGRIIVVEYWSTESAAGSSAIHLEINDIINPAEAMRVPSVVVGHNWKRPKKSVVSVHGVRQHTHSWSVDYSHLSASNVKRKRTHIVCGIYVHYHKCEPFQSFGRVVIQQEGSVLSI